MKYENDTFPEAIKILADRAGVKLPEVEETPEQKKKAGKRMRLLEVNKEAAKYFTTCYVIPVVKWECGI